MKWATHKEAKGTLIGNTITYEIEKTDQGFRGITFFVDGEPVLMAGKVDYSLGIFLPAPPETQDRWVLSGKFLGLTDIVPETFEHEHEAKERLREFAERAEPDDCGLTVEKRKVEIE